MRLSKWEITRLIVIGGTMKYGRVRPGQAGGGGGGPVGGRWVATGW